MFGSKCAASLSSFNLLFWCIISLGRAAHGGNHWPHLDVKHAIASPSLSPTLSATGRSPPSFSPSSTKKSRPSSKALSKRKKRKKILEKTDEENASRTIPKRKKMVKKKRSKIHNPVSINSDYDYHSPVLKTQRPKKRRPTTKDSLTNIARSSTSECKGTKTRTNKRVKGLQRSKSNHSTSSHQTERTKRKKKKRPTGVKTKGETSAVYRETAFHAGKRKKKKRKKTKKQGKKSVLINVPMVVLDSTSNEDVQTTGALSPFDVLSPDSFESVIPQIGRAHV